MIRVHNISFSFQEKFILKDVNFNLPRGKTGVLIGPNGAGKTTLLEILTKNIRDFKGDLFLQEKSVREYSEKELSLTLTYVPQFLDWNKSFRCEDYFSFSRFPYNSSFLRYSEREERVLGEILDGLRLKDFMKKKLGDLSGGERRRLSIGAALFQETPLIIFDEPFSSLDPVYKKMICEFLKKWQIKYGTSYFMTVHDIFWGQSVGDFFFALKEGSLWKLSQFNSFFSQNSLEDLFNLPFDIYSSKEGLNIIMPKRILEED